MVHPLSDLFWGRGNGGDLGKEDQTIPRSGLLWIDGSADVHGTIEYRDRDHFLDGRLSFASKSG